MAQPIDHDAPAPDHPAPDHPAPDHPALNHRATTDGATTDGATSDRAAAECPTSGITAWTFLQEHMPAPRVLETSAGRVAALSLRSPVKETPNEDAAAVISLGNQTAVLVVADGMGGGAAGERAAGLAVSALVQALHDYHSDDATLLRTAVLNGIESANVEVCRLGLGAGTTLAVVEVQRETVRPYHVGDSLVLLIGNHGKLKLQTVSHSPVGYAVEAGLLDAETAMHHQDRHLVSNFVGSPEMRIEVGAPVKMSPRDTLLLASDGLSDNLLVAEIAEQIRKGDLAAGTAVLASRARQRMVETVDGVPSKPDDLTLLTFRRA